MTTELKDQDDPIAMYLVVRESLNMSSGKTAAQCAHASQMLTLEYFLLREESQKIQKWLQSPRETENMKEKHLSDYKIMAPKISIFGEWMSSAYRKIVLRASDKEWTKLKEEFKNDMVLIVDAGLTEIVAGSETCIGLWPCRKKTVSKTVKHLQVLK